MGGRSLAYYAGVVAGVLLVAIVSIIWKKALEKKGETAGEYDERQKVQRGVAFQWAYMTLLILLAANSVASGVLDLYWAEPGVDSFLCLLVSVCVFVIMCIQRDAYFTVTQKPGRYIGIFALVALCQVPATLMHLHDGGFVEDGLLTIAVMNPAALILFTAVLIALLLKLRREKTEEEGDGA